MNTLSIGQIVAWIIGGVIALVTGGVGTAIAQGWQNRSTTKAEAARLEAAEESERKAAAKAETDRLQLVQEIERKAYDRASEASDRAYSQLQRRCDSCMERVDLLRGALESLIHMNDLTRPIMERLIRADPSILPKAEIEMLKDLHATMESAHRTLWD